jgi:hypothetical protein
MSDTDPSNINDSPLRFIAGGPDDPRHGYGLCLNCPGRTLHYLEAARVWVYDDGSSHTGHEIELLPEPTPNRTSEAEIPRELESIAPKVVQRITDIGCYYRAGNLELGPFTVKDEEDPQFDTELAAKLGVKPKDVVLARLIETVRPTTFEEIAEILGSTIRQDEPTKLILFCAGILTFTSEDQINVLMSGESAGGKSYITLEVAAYFPSTIQIVVARASPTAFFHDAGTWDKEAKVLRVNLRQMLLIFLDQPHYTLLEMLRSLLSHDKRELLHKITDKSRRGELRTKNVVIEGYPTVIFCAAKLTLDEQERTRVFILSPETGQEKIDESLRLAVARIGDREGFKQWVDSHPRRRLLRARVEAIQAAQIKQVIVEDQAEAYERFRQVHSHLAPRHQRDLPRILSLIKSHAMLNWRYRETRGPGTIVANREDVEAAFWLYGLIAKPNELGLSPQVYEIYESVIKPLLDKGQSASRKEIMCAYREFYGRSLSRKKLEEEILPSLETASLITQETDPNDKRRVLVCHPDAGNNSPSATHSGNVPLMWGTPLGERIQVGTEWLRKLEKLDAEGWAERTSFTAIVGGPETVQSMLRDGLIELHPFEPEKVRLVRR